MNFKKSSVLVIFILVISLFLVSCSTGGGVTLKSIWDKILDIGMLKFLGVSGETVVTGFMRLLIGILVFAILFEVSRLIGLSSNIRAVISIILSIMVSVFMPGVVLAAIGSTYTIIVAFFLLGVPIFGGGYLLYRIPTRPRVLRLVRIAILFLLLWLIIVVRDHALLLLGKTVGGP